MSEIRSKILAFSGWIIFLGVLMAAAFSDGFGRRDAGGPVTVICMQTIEAADAILVQDKTGAILIDAGEGQDAAHILEVLLKRGVEKLDYMILSHPDQDHIGGAMDILEQIPVGRVIEPYYTENNERLTALNSWLEEQDIPVLYPTKTRRLKAGGISFVVYPPLEKHYNDTNNYSLSVLVQHERVNMLFTGDALRKRSEELLYTDWPAIALYKVPHHGRANSVSEKLFQALQPSFAVVTGSEADEIIKKASQEAGTKLLYTAGGDVFFVSDGNSLKREEE